MCRSDFCNEALLSMKNVLCTTSRWCLVLAVVAIRQPLLLEVRDAVIWLRPRYVSASSKDLSSMLLARLCRSLSLTDVDGIRGLHIHEALVMILVRLHGNFIASSEGLILATQESICSV